jgi:hypothetical protein
VSASIEYVPNPKKPTTAQVFNGENMLFGFYKVRFPDGWTVAVPHSGWAGTISEEPLDPENDEHRAVILAAAERAKPES